MSNRPHRRRRPAPTRSVTATAAVLAARACGCTCRPDVTRRHIEGETRLTVAHDADCPAVDAASQLVLIVPRRGAVR